MIDPIDHDYKRSRRANSSYKHLGKSVYERDRKTLPSKLLGPHVELRALVQIHNLIIITHKLTSPSIQTASYFVILTIAIDHRVTDYASRLDHS